MVIWVGLFMNSHVSSSTRKDSVAENRNDCRRSGLRQAPQDEAQVGDEAHVEHAVGLVDDQHLDAARRPDVLLQVVDEPTGRADQHVAAFAQRVALLVVVDAAVHGQDPESRVRAEQVSVRLDLDHQLARRRDDEDPRRGRAALGRSRPRQAAREGRDEERGGLAGAGLRLPATSLPRRASGRAASWMGVAETNPASRIPRITGSGSWSDGKSDDADVLVPAHAEPAPSAAVRPGRGATAVAARLPKMRAAMIPTS